MYWIYNYFTESQFILPPYHLLPVVRQSHIGVRLHVHVAYIGDGLWWPALEGYSPLLEGVLENPS